MSYCLESDVVKYSRHYGYIDLNSKYFDDSKDLGGTDKTLIDHIIKSIKIYSGKKDDIIIIGGMQITYWNLKTKEILELNARKGDIQYEDEDMETFDIKTGEYLTNFFIRFNNDNNYITQLGFETNKKRKILKGSETGELKYIDINGGENYILGTFGNFNQKLDSFGVLYINFKDYIKNKYRAYFELEYKIRKDKTFKNKIEQNFENLSESNKYLFRSCILPNSLFLEIMKFCINE